MNRQIKFRAKSVSSNEWVEGYYYYNNVSHEHHIISDLADGEFHDWHVRPEAISQYANVTDCNDKKIFEGDILRNEVYDWNNEKVGYGYYEVYWEDAENGFHISPINETAEIEEIRKWHWLNDMEIVGNRFDNPELLKEE